MEHIITIDTYFYLFTIIALIGVILNIQKDKRGFILWMVSNLAFAIQSYLNGLYNVTILFIVQFIFSAWGVYSWK